MGNPLMRKGNCFSPKRNGHRGVRRRIPVIDLVAVPVEAVTAAAITEEAGPWWTLRETGSLGSRMQEQATQEGAGIRGPRGGV
jgi:hypothetical protein